MVVSRLIAFSAVAATEVSLTLIVISAAKVVFAEVPLAANGANRAVISAAGDAAIVVTFAKLPPRDVMSLTAFKADAVADVSLV